MENPRNNENKRISVLRNMWTIPPVINSSYKVYSIYPGKTPSFGCENRKAEWNDTGFPNEPVRKKPVYPQNSHKSQSVDKKHVEKISFR